MIKTTNIINLIKKSNNFSITDTNINFEKYFNIDGQLIFTGSYNEGKKIVKIIKFLQGYYYTIDDNFKTNINSVAARDLKEVLNNLINNEPKKVPLWETGIKVPYKNNEYTVLKDKNNNFVMIESKYKECFTDVYFSISNNDNDNIIYIADQKHIIHITAACICLKTAIDNEGNKVSIKEYIRSLL